jgi:hypothetical protein
MKKQLTSWKPYQKTSATWDFFKVNDNRGVDLKQSQIMCCIVCHGDFFKVNDNRGVDLKQSQIMCCIVCHDETMGFKILALCKRFRKDLITYNKACMIFCILKLVLEKP